MVDLPARTPPRTVSPNSTERRRRCAAGSTLRLRARCDPYGGGLPELPGRHGCACATGSRGSLRDAGCSAEKSACSRVTPRTLGKNHDDVVPVTGGARSMGKSLVLSSVEPHAPQGMQKRLQWLVDATTPIGRGQTVHRTVATILCLAEVVHSRLLASSGRSSWVSPELHTSTHSLWKTMWIKGQHDKLILTHRFNTRESACRATTRPSPRSGAQRSPNWKPAPT